MINPEYKLEIVNEDGTGIDDFPKNPLKEKWDKLYMTDLFGRPCNPISGYQENGRPYENYGCVLCHSKTCHHSDNFIVPDEDKEVYAEYKQQIKEYNMLHNPEMMAKIEEYEKLHKEQTYGQ